MNASAPTHARLFLAMQPQATVRQAIDALVRRWSWCPGSAIYAASDWHATLHFLGHVSAEQVGPIAAGACLPFEPFEWTLDRWRLWPGGVVVLYPSFVPPSLLALHERLGALLGDMGLPVERRPYQPHLTLARHANTAAPPDGIAPIAWPVHRFALLAATGHLHPRYEVLCHCGPAPAVDDDQP